MPANGSRFEVEVARSWSAVPAAPWDALVGEGSPFLEHEFLLALEQTGCATAATGWQPRPILVREVDEATGSTRLIAGAPGWVKAHSMGEFVYDHGWASGAERAGIRYYPKMIIGVPFSPVTGDRLLTDGRPQSRKILIEAIKKAGSDVEGTHFLFDTAEEAAELEKEGYFSRIQHQFHWINEGYSSHEDFLQRFPSKERNKLRRERKEVANLRIHAGIGASRAVIDTLYDFYSDTTARYFYGHRYLTREFFRRLADTWGHRLQIVIARDGDDAVGGALNVVKGKRLYGRYWGARESVPFLHFEVCYHQGIAWAIEHGLEAFEPGHGGEHKFKRGFLPQVTWSSHRFRDARLQRAFGDWSAKEAVAVRAQIDEIRAASKMREAAPKGDP